jgi:DNA-nicking Smr family endonuclease
VTKKNLSAEDRDLFREAVGKVQSVKSDKVFGDSQAKPKPFPNPRPAHFHETLLHEADIAPVGVEDEISFARENLPKNCLMKLRQGYFVPEAEIDLHGLNSDEAKRELLGFVRDGVRSGCRCVHVVHGKGYRSQENYPILKNNINLWLRQHKDVLAFCSAMPKDGGSGAVYVLLQLA